MQKTVSSTAALRAATREQRFRAGAGGHPPPFLRTPPLLPRQSPPAAQRRNVGAGCGGGGGERRLMQSAWERGRRLWRRRTASSVTRGVLIQERFEPPHSNGGGPLTSVCEHVKHIRSWLQPSIEAVASLVMHTRLTQNTILNGECGSGLWICRKRTPQVLTPGPLLRSIPLQPALRRRPRPNRRPPSTCASPSSPSLPTPSVRPSRPPPPPPPVAPPPPSW